MKIKQLIEKLGGDRAAIAKQAGITVFQLNNMVYKDVEVEELKDGRFVVVRKDATYFSKPKVEEDKGKTIYLKLIRDYGGYNELKCGDIVEYKPFNRVWRGMTEQERVSRGLYVNCGGMNLYEDLKLNKDVVIHE